MKHFRCLLFCLVASCLLLSSLPQAQAEQTETVTCVASDETAGIETGWGSNYTAQWSKTSGSMRYGSLVIGQEWLSPAYLITRSYLIFDTTSIPEVLLSSAVLRLYKIDDLSTWDFNITVQNGQPSAPHVPVVEQDFDQSLYSGSGGSASSGDAPVFSWINITLNPVWVNTDGFTKLCLRCDKDISQTPPVTDMEFDVYEGGETLDPPHAPQLTVTYVEVEGAAGGPREDDWVPLSIPNLPLHARRVLEGVQQFIREHEQLRAVVGIGLIMVVGGVIIKWDRKGKRKLL